MGYTIATALILLGFGEGSYVSLIFVLVVPGYVLVAALFPRQTDADWLERLALSLGMSAAVVPLLILVLNFTPLGTRFLPIVVTVASFTMITSCVALWRRLRLLPSQRLSVTVAFSLARWEKFSALDKSVTIAIAASLIIASGAVAYFVLSAHRGEAYTEFAILGPDGSASSYPTRLTVLQSGTLILGITNHESARVNYALRVDLVAVQIIYNESQGANETVELNRTTWSLFNITLVDGQSWIQPYTFRINATGLWKVQFLLFKDSDVSASYRELHLFVTVT